MFFISHACKPACACKIGDIKPTVQSSRVSTRCVHDARMHVRMHTPYLDYACMQIVSQGQWNKLYKHVYVLRCSPLVIQDINHAKEYLTVKLKRLEGVSFTNYHQ